MKFEHNWEFDTEEEMNETFKGGNRKLHNLIVDTALANLKTRKKTIPVVSIYTKEDDMIYDIMIERLDMVETLEQNLQEVINDTIIMEDLDDNNSEDLDSAIAEELKELINLDMENDEDLSLKKKQ